MKRIALFLLLSSAAYAQTAARVDIPLQTYGPTVPVSGGPLPQVLWTAQSTVQLCTHPSATYAACQAAPITTYTDSTEATTCAAATPMVQLPGTTCTASTGTAANIGFWYAGGIVDYYITTSYGGPYGPYTYNPPANAVAGNFISAVDVSPQTMAGALAGPAFTATTSVTTPSLTAGSVNNTLNAGACGLANRPSWCLVRI